MGILTFVSLCCGLTGVRVDRWTYSDVITKISWMDK